VSPPPDTFIIYVESSLPSADDYLVRLQRTTRLESIFKKIPPRINSPEADPNLPKCSNSRQKLNVDHKARFRYLKGYWFRLIGESIVGLQLKPIHNSQFFLAAHRISNVLSLGIECCTIKKEK
jgi:hypothetical protein